MKWHRRILVALMSVGVLFFVAFSAYQYDNMAISCFSSGIYSAESAVSFTDTGTKKAEYPLFELEQSDSAELDYLAKTYGAVGVSVAVIKNGRVAYHYEYGWADREEKIPMSADSKVRIASISKPVAAMAYMKLCDDGVVSPDTEMSEIFGENEVYEDVTMRSLLCHVSGLSDANSLNKGIRLQTLTQELQIQDIFVREPFKKWEYSNFGFGIVGAAVEKASGMLFQDYTAEIFFKPMGIDASWDGSYISDSDLIASTYWSSGYKGLSAKKQTEALEQNALGENYSYIAGGLKISAVDLARVFTVLINDGEYMGRQILSQEAVEQMETVQYERTGKKFVQCIGLRYSSKCYDGRSMYFHPGNAYGVLSLVAYDKSDKSGVVVITTGADMRRDDYGNFKVCSDMLNYIYRNVINE